MDLATESLPTVRSKVQAYLDFRARGEQGPEDVMPWVLLSTVDGRRAEALDAMLRRLPGADGLVTVVRSEQAAAHMIRVLRE